MSVVLQSSGGGSVTLQEPSTASNFTQTLPAGTGNVVVSGINSAITSGTAVASTSGTSIDFTGIPSWVKRITVMFQGVSLSGTDNILVQLGTGSTPTFATSGYLSSTVYISGSTAGSTNSTAGFIINSGAAPNITSGVMTVFNITGNAWVSSGSTKTASNNVTSFGGDVSLGAVLTAVRITTTGTNTFDAGSINILYE